MGALHASTTPSHHSRGIKMDMDNTNTNIKNQSQKNKKKVMEMCLERVYDGKRVTEKRGSTSPRSPSSKAKSKSLESLAPAIVGSPKAMEMEGSRSSVKRNRDMIKPFKAGPVSAHRKYSSASEESSGTVARD